jgi:hypothetical protein
MKNYENNNSNKKKDRIERRNVDSLVTIRCCLTHLEGVRWR